MSMRENMDYRVMERFLRTWPTVWIITSEQVKHRSRKSSKIIESAIHRKSPETGTCLSN